MGQKQWCTEGTILQCKKRTTFNIVMNYVLIFMIYWTYFTQHSKNIPSFCNVVYRNPRKWTVSKTHIKLNIQNQQFMWQLLFIHFRLALHHEPQPSNGHTYVCVCVLVIKVDYVNLIKKGTGCSKWQFTDKIMKAYFLTQYFNILIIS
jgi:hypothetical protein